MPESILEEAQRIIHGARNVAYGHPRDNFAAIAALWNGYLAAMGDRPEFSPQDVANMMILMKVGRVCNDNWHRDSYTDIAGYAGTVERMQEPIDEPLRDGPWKTLDEVPADHPVVYAANGCRWQNYGKGHLETRNGMPYASSEWMWNSQHAAENGYSYSKEGPFTSTYEYKNQDQ